MRPTDDWDELRRLVRDFEMTGRHEASRRRNDPSANRAGDRFASSSTTAFASSPSASGTDSPAAFASSPSASRADSPTAVASSSSASATELPGALANDQSPKLRDGADGPRQRGHPRQGHPAGIAGRKSRSSFDTSDDQAYAKLQQDIIGDAARAAPLSPAPAATPSASVVPRAPSVDAGDLMARLAGAFSTADADADANGASARPDRNADADSGPANDDGPIDASAGDSAIDAGGGASAESDAAGFDGAVGDAGDLPSVDDVGDAGDAVQGVETDPDPESAGRADRDSAESGEPADDFDAADSIDDESFDVDALDFDALDADAAEDGPFVDKPGDADAVDAAPAEVGGDESSVAGQLSVAGDSPVAESHFGAASPVADDSARQAFAAIAPEIRSALEDLSRGGQGLLAAAQQLTHLQTLYVVKD
jgi:hypothetical protein